MMLQDGLPTRLVGQCHSSVEREGPTLGDNAATLLIQMKGDLPKQRYDVKSNLI